MNLPRSSYFTITEKPTKGGALVAQLVKLAPQSAEAVSSQQPGVIFRPLALCCMLSLLFLTVSCHSSPMTSHDRITQYHVYYNFSIGT